MLELIASGLILIQSLLPATLVSQSYERVTEQAMVQRVAASPRAMLETPAYSLMPSASSVLALDQDNKASLVYDRATGTVLYEKNADTKLPIASVAKVMTALVILQNHSLDEIVTVPPLAPQPFASQAMNISPGEQFKLSEALMGTLVYSANDMAQALAVWDSGSESQFVDKMNTQAKLWGLNNTEFKDATGLSPNGSMSSARDLSILASIALRSDFFRMATSQPRYSVTTLSGKRYLVTTTNKLLGSGGVVGTKTGYTLEAGECLLSLTSRQGHEIIGVILGSSDRFGQTRTLLNATFTNYQWK
jgi:D-alanyl-D-alanine carboxypeptidase (penicillin-binding protein 5/6)